MGTGFSFIEDFEKEDVLEVLKELTVTCSSCRLAQDHPYNRGMVYRGNPMAKIAVVGAAPSDSETEKGVPLVGMVGREFEKWMAAINIDTQREIFITNVIQCMPPKVMLNGKKKVRDPEKDETNACFGPRCLRVLRAMPNLEAVMILGWPAAKAFLGTSNDENIPKTKTHEGGWFESSLLPGVGIFCLNHPADIVFAESSEKKMIIQKFLGYFKREALVEKKISGLAKAAQERREELGLGVY
ncbi:MAG: uracil-DNA glycosylase family protein [Terracidiphilus sp.]|jgi:DNA polymerase